VPPESLRDLRRAQIVSAARTIVARDGIDALTIASLEASVSFSRGVITYHFANKDEIVKEVLASAVEEIDAATKNAVLASDTSEEKIRAVIRANVRGFVDRPEAGRVLLTFWGQIPGDERIRDLNARLFDKYRKRVRRLIEEGQSNGAFSADVRPAATSSVILGVVLGIALQWYFDPHSIDVDAAIADASSAMLTRLRPAPDRKNRSVEPASESSQRAQRRKDAKRGSRRARA
jgi:AcrR family transcriptional regulator